MRAIFQHDPDSPHAHSLLGLIGNECGDHVASIRRGKAALEREPNDADALLYMGASYMATGKTEEAVQAFQEIYL